MEEKEVVKEEVEQVEDTEKNYVSKFVTKIICRH